MQPQKGLKPSFPLHADGGLENRGLETELLVLEGARHPSGHISCIFQCSDKSCLRTPSLKKRVSDASLEGKKDSGMLKYIRLQVWTLERKQPWGRNREGPPDSLLASVWELWCQLAWWHDGPCNWWARVPPSVQGKYPSLLDSQLPLRRGLGSLAVPVPFPSLSTPGELASHRAWQWCSQVLKWHSLGSNPTSAALVLVLVQVT